jgi:hypothetical protein
MPRARVATGMTRVPDLRVGALELVVVASDVAGVYTTANGGRERFRVGSTAEIVQRIDALRAELRDPMCISTGRTPRLREFCASWGRRFLPATLTSDAPDVLVVVPHGPTHDLPVHLVEVDAGEGEPHRPLGAVVGLSYASSRSLFIRCVSRNAARRRALSQWRCDGQPRAPAAAWVRSVMSGGADVLGDLGDAFRSTCARVAEHFDGERTVFSSGSFPYTRSAIKAATRRAPHPSALCVMAHGFIDEANHRMSGLLVERDTMGVAARAIPLHDGRYFDFRDLPLRRVPRWTGAGGDAEVFTAAELEIDGEISSELVMLLGCSAGWGRVMQGDEPASLAETWLKIGAASAVAPMWDAPIAAVQSWTDEFIDGWTRLDLPKALAVRRAMQRMRDGPFRDAPERLGVMTLRGDWL